MRFTYLLRSLLCLFICMGFFGCAHQPGTFRRDRAKGDLTHLVSKGETLFSIAKQYGVSVDEIARANEIPQSANLTVGQPLLIPDPKNRTPTKPGTSAAVPKPFIDDGRKIELSWPITKGVIFRTFDQTTNRLHEGLSIGAPANTPIKSAQDGEIIFAAPGPSHLGQMVLIKHMDPFVTIYGHLSEIKVKVGQRVKKGDVIGIVGTSGGAESPRVYFELRKDRMPVNPEPYLPKG